MWYGSLSLYWWFKTGCKPFNSHRTGNQGLGTVVCEGIWDFAVSLKRYTLWGGWEAMTFKPVSCGLVFDTKMVPLIWDCREIGSNGYSFYFVCRKQQVIVISTLIYVLPFLQRLHHVLFHLNLATTLWDGLGWEQVAAQGYSTTSS